MDVEIIDTGFFYADGGAMFGAIPKTAWSRRYLSDSRNRCILAMRSLLVKTGDGKVILVDSGAGEEQIRSLSYYGFFNRTDLIEELAKREVAPEQVTDVILTHLHFDHCGYTTRYLPGNEKSVPLFTHARHWVGQRQWENFLRPNPLEKDSYFIENMKAVYEAGLIRFPEEDQELYPGVRLRLFDGHTPGQIVPGFDTGKETFVFAGDVIPLVANLSPEWISAYDTHPVISYKEKIRLLEEAVRKKQTIIFCHDAYTRQGKIKKVGNSYKLI